MTTLQLYISDDKHPEAKPPHTFVLEHTPSADSASESASGKDLKFKRTALIHESKHSTVYRGILSGYVPDDIAVVCKLAGHAKGALSRFRNEAEFYETNLCDLQGHCIPRFYGLYKGSLPFGDAVCMVLEDCGECVGDYRLLSEEWCIRSVEVLMAIHERGVQHNDFQARNMVVDDLKHPQRLVVIDFEYATHHDCQRKLDIALYNYPPNLEKFGCDELYKVAEFSEVWTPPTLRFLGCYYFLAHLRKPEDLVEGNEICELYTPEVALNMAKASIHDYFRQWGYRKDWIFRNKYKALSAFM